MIRSMTAFARHQSQFDAGRIIWELRSVNSRFLEVNFRIPDSLRALELPLRNRVQSRLARGKVDVSLKLITDAKTSAAIELNEALAASVADIAEQISALMPASATPTPMDIMRWPGVVTDVEPDSDSLSETLLASIDSALDELIAGREREGARLAEAIQQRGDAIKPLVAIIRNGLPEVLAALRDRMRTRLAELSENLDNQRVEQEMVMLAQKLDVAEELDRLDGHLIELTDALNANEPVGRRLDFLMQEFNREANTVASKSVDGEITKAAVELKVLIEQMREQVQNIE